MPAEAEIVDEIPVGAKFVAPQEKILPGTLNASTLELLRKVKVNSELPHSGVELLRFFDVDEAGNRVEIPLEEERLRVEIWEMHHEQQFSVKDISRLVGRSRDYVNKRLEICRMRYDEWLEANGSKLFGTANQRLFDHIADLQSLLEENRTDLENAETAKEKVQLRKLQLEIMSEMAKYKAIKPPEVVFHSHSHTVAEESRAHLKRLFG